MSKVFGIFQIGPVQEFITCAKKTQDFWSGSYLLSFLNCIAIDKVIQNCGEDKNVIIYHSLDNQLLFEYVQGLRKKGQKPWQDNPYSKKNELIPTVPNRFVCRLDESHASKILNQAEDAVKETFSEFIRYVKLELETKITKRFSKNNPIQSQKKWNDIWTRQGKEFFEIYWVISPLEPNDYSKSYQQAEVLLGARKAIRDFNQINEPGYKCTLCGQYEPLNAQLNGSLRRENLKDFWDKIRQATGYRFRDSEHLCAICTTKRLAPTYIFGRDFDFPSTSSFAVADFIGNIIKENQEKPTAFLDKGGNLIADFIQKAKVVAQQERLDFKVEPLPKHNREIGKISAPALLELVRLDGDWVIEETYNNIIKQRESLKINSRNTKDAKTSLKALINRLKKLMKEQELISLGPGKYYAVFQMDGDNIGEKISQKKSENEHRQFSKDICDFSANLIPSIIEKNHFGKVIYFGGDEGIAFVSLQDILSVIEKCRNNFENKFSNTTISIGVVIAHHQQALSQVLFEVRKVVKKVKDDLDKKNGFCIALMKRSGGTTYGMAHWEYDELKVIPLLQDLVKYYQEGKISDRWYYQFAREKLGLLEVIDIRRGIIRINRDIAQLEICRLIIRHANKNKISSTELNRLLERLKILLFKVNNWEQFMGLMDVATYLTRGGGR